MQFAVPQFTDVEDKLIGPLTLKQFLMLLATGGIVMFFWSLFGINIIFFLFALPTALLGVLVAFAKFNGRPFYMYVGPLVNFFSSEKVMIYSREGAQDIVSAKKPETPKTKTLDQTAEQAEGAESRLRKLAYLLDQKTHEEEELIGHASEKSHKVSGKSDKVPDKSNKNMEPGIEFTTMRDHG